MILLNQKQKLEAKIQVHHLSGLFAHIGALGRSQAPKARFFVHVESWVQARCSGVLGSFEISAKISILGTF